ncbi:MAG: ABC-2 transporter permease [Allobaculum sp.]|nr:ABC-2 transporter permease [Allobaculum sp.]
MKGLLWKDFMLVWQSKWVLLLVSVLVGGGLMYFQGQSVDSPTTLGWISFLCILFSMQGVSSILTDRISGWNLYQTTFPISRKQAIREKYLLSWILGFIGLVMGLAFALLYNRVLFPRFIEMDSWYINFYIAVLIWLSSMALAIPLSLWLSKNQYFVALLASFLLPTLLIVIWNQSITVEQIGLIITVNLSIPLLGYMALGCGILCVISYLIVPNILIRFDQR